jgi:competence protein ComGC
MGSKMTKSEGFSLVEMLISLLVVLLVVSMLLSGIIFMSTVKKKAQINQDLGYNERYLNLYFQKQILQSEVIYVRNNRVYLQDLESPDTYYNYYQYSNGLLRRYKVDKKNLNPILGGNSQFAQNLRSFSLTSGSHQEIVLKYSLEYQGKVYFREITITHGRRVEFR